MAAAVMLAGLALAFAARAPDPHDFHTSREIVRDPRAVRISTAVDAWAANESVIPTTVTETSGASGRPMIIVGDVLRLRLRAVGHGWRGARCARVSPT